MFNITTLEGQQCCVKYLFVAFGEKCTLGISEISMRILQPLSLAWVYGSTFGGNTANGGSTHEFLYFHDCLFKTEQADDGI